MSSHKQGKILIIKSIVIMTSDTIHSGHRVVSPTWRGDKQIRKCNISVSPARCSMSWLSPVAWTDGKVTKKSQSWGLFTIRHQNNGRKHVCRSSRLCLRKMRYANKWCIICPSLWQNTKDTRFPRGKMDFCLNNSEVPTCLLGPAVLVYSGSGCHGQQTQ